MPFKWNENEICLWAPSSSPNTEAYRNNSCLFFHLSSMKTDEWVRFEYVWRDKRGSSYKISSDWKNILHYYNFVEGTVLTGKWERKRELICGKFEHEIVFSSRHRVLYSFIRVFYMGCVWISILNFLKISLSW